MTRLLRLTLAALAFGLAQCAAAATAPADTSVARSAPDGNITFRAFLVRVTPVAAPHQAPKSPLLVVEGVPGDAPAYQMMEALREANPDFRIELVGIAEMPLVVGRPAALRLLGPEGLRLDLSVEALAEDPEKEAVARNWPGVHDYVPIHMDYRIQQNLPQLLLRPEAWSSGGGQGGNTLSRPQFGVLEQLNTLSWPAAEYGSLPAGARWRVSRDPVVVGLVTVSRRPVPIRPYEAGLAAETEPAEDREGLYWARSVTEEFTDTPIMEALRVLAKQFDRPIMVMSHLPEDLRVSVNLRAADPEDAIQAVCQAAGLTCEINSTSIHISAPPTVQVGGATVPLLGAIPGLAETLSFRVPVEGPAGSRQPLGSLPAAECAASRFEGDDTLVDLEVKDAAIREAMAKLSEGSGVKITVHQAVPQGIKVTAKMLRMPLGEVLALIVNKANLTYTVGRIPDETIKALFERGSIPRKDYEAHPGKPEIHIVPKPQLKVSGPGVPGAFTGALPEGLAEYEEVSVNYGSNWSGRVVPPPFTPWSIASFGGDDTLVDLEVEEATLRDTMRMLSEASGIPIVVAHAVSDEIKVTAKTYRMPLGEALALIVSKANLTYTVGRIPDETIKALFERGSIPLKDYESYPGKPEIHIVPKPMLELSGPGIWDRDPLAAYEMIRPIRSVLVLSPTLAGAAGPGVMTCPKCGAHWFTRVCPQCGAELPEPATVPESPTLAAAGIMTCPKCGVHFSTRLCPQCGARLPEPATAPHTGQ